MQLLGQSHTDKAAESSFCTHTDNAAESSFCTRSAAFGEETAQAKDSFAAKLKLCRANLMDSAAVKAWQPEQCSCWGTHTHRQVHADKAAVNAA